MRIFFTKEKDDAPLNKGNDIKEEGEMERERESERERDRAKMRGAGRRSTKEKRKKCIRQD